MIVFVGLAPSTKNENPKLPFHGTKSWDRLQRWIRESGVKSYSLYNLFNEVLPKAKVLTIEELKPAAQRIATSCRYSDGVVALGVDASRALKSAGIKHYRLPHPSQRNRNFNHKGYEPEVVLKFKAWVTALYESKESF